MDSKFESSETLQGSSHKNRAPGLIEDALTPQFVSQFEARKADHLKLSLDESNQALGHSEFEGIVLDHEALPDFDFSEIDLTTSTLGETLPTPLLISSMTAGHPAGVDINLRLARACEEHGWVMGVGSQRRQLVDASAAEECQRIRKAASGAVLLGNIGISQVIQCTVDDIQLMVDSLGAAAMVVHLNSLQECLQLEGTPNFRGSLKALEILVEELSVPVVVKETGCGFSGATLRRLRDLGVAAIDVSGLGGTHWGRIEGARASPEDVRKGASLTFQNWGISTTQSFKNALESGLRSEIWVSGGLRNGLDVARFLSMGARLAGFAKPALEAALQDEATLRLWMKRIEFELRVAMFCTGSIRLDRLLGKGRWAQDPPTPLGE